MQHTDEGCRMVKGSVTGVLVVAACVTLASCGGRKAGPMAPTSAPSTTGGAAAPTDMMPGSPKSEIERLFAEVEQRRTELALPEPTPEAPHSPASPMSAPPLSTDATCKPAKTDRCTTSCTLSDAICTNADKICKLASELAGDTWAADKCSRAKQTCDAAHTSCCGCT
jgi:hypothetical protein